MRTETANTSARDAAVTWGARLRRWSLRGPLLLLAGLLLMLLGPLGVLATGGASLEGDWRLASHDSAGLAPDPERVEEAIVQVYAARTFRWRGAFGVHPWIAVKRPGQRHYTTYQVIGWRSDRGMPSVAAREERQPDRRWYGAMPVLLADHRGPAAGSMIDAIERAVASYPWADRYHVWPGPNSNTFVAYVARQVPALRLDLPANAIGKDYLGDRQWWAAAPSGTGWQLSLYGLLGLTLAVEEGIELNLLGLSVGVDVNDLALRLPGVGNWQPLALLRQRSDG